MIGAHLDSVPEGPGIVDDGSGVASLLEIATRLGAEPSVQNTVRFAFFGNEETGSQGARGYLEGLSTEDREKIKLYVNVDMVASPNGGYLFRAARAATESAGLQVRSRRAKLADQQIKAGVNIRRSSSSLGTTNHRSLMPHPGWRRRERRQAVSAGRLAWGGGTPRAKLALPVSQQAGTAATRLGLALPRLCAGAHRSLRPTLCDIDRTNRVNADRTNLVAGAHPLTPGMMRARPVRARQAHHALAPGRRYARPDRAARRVVLALVLDELARHVRQLHPDVRAQTLHGTPDAARQVVGRTRRCSVGNEEDSIASRLRLEETTASYPRTSLPRADGRGRRVGDDRGEWWGRPIMTPGRSLSLRRRTWPARIAVDVNDKSCAEATRELALTGAYRLLKLHSAATGD
jgi:hypothetical protein